MPGSELNPNLLRLFSPGGFTHMQLLYGLQM